MTHLRRIIAQVIFFFYFSQRYYNNGKTTPKIHLAHRDCQSCRFHLLCGNPSEMDSVPGQRPWRTGLSEADLPFPYRGNQGTVRPLHPLRQEERLPILYRRGGERTPPGGPDRRPVSQRQTAGEPGSAGKGENYVLEFQQPTYPATSGGHRAETLRGYRPCAGRKRLHEGGIGHASHEFPIGFCSQITRRGVFFREHLPDDYTDPTLFP